MKTRTRASRLQAFHAAADLAPLPPGLDHDAACPECKAPLELLQPDLMRPERLLGICPLCRSWTLVDEGTPGRTRLTLLPRPG